MAGDYSVSTRLRCATSLTTNGGTQTVANRLDFLAFDMLSVSACAYGPYNRKLV
jgi:hypothetical protein